MRSKNSKRLQLARETVRSLSSLRNSDLVRANGGISGPKGCHSLVDVCEPGSGGALCLSKGICPSGAGVGSCGQDC
jgi:hypothetical protein